MTMNPLFTIAIPAYKRKFLYEAVDSCLQQTYKNLEIVIVNDASPEDLDSVILQFNDPRIRYYRNKENCGAVNVVDNWNICLSHAKGDYIICMGDDDRLLPYCLEEYYNLMKKYPNLGVYHAWTELIDEESNFISIQQPRPEFETALSLAWNRWNGRNKQFIGDFCYDTERLRQEGGFYKIPLAWGSDDITAVRAARHAGIANTQTICFQYRVNRQTITKTGNASLKISAVLQEKDWFLNFISEQHAAIIDLDSLDAKYLICLKQDLPIYFREKLKREIIIDMKSNPLRIFKWILNQQFLELDNKELFKCWLKSIVK